MISKFTKLQFKQTTKENMKKLILSILSLILTGCMGHPKSIKPIMDYELNNCKN